MAAGIGGHGRSELARVLAASRRFVTPASAAKSLDIGAPAAARRLARWAEDGWLRRVWRGLYIAVPVDAVNPAAWSENALVVAAEVWAPCYFTGWTAANHWALTEQVFRTTVLKTSSRVRSATARLLDNDYLVSHVAPDVLAWGMRTEWRAETRLRFADPARTVVDMLDEPRIGAGIRHTAEVLVSYLDAHDPMRLVEWGDRLGNHAIFERLGYLIETVGLDRPALVDACLDRVSSGVALLDPDGPGDGSRIMRWRLRVNAMVGFEGAA